MGKCIPRGIFLTSIKRITKISLALRVKEKTGKCWSSLFSRVVKKSFQICIFQQNNFLIFSGLCVWRIKIYSCCHENSSFGVHSFNQHYQYITQYIAVCAAFQWWWNERVMVYIKVMMVKCSSMMVKYSLMMVKLVYHTLISPSLTSTWPSLAWSKHHSLIWPSLRSCTDWNVKRRIERKISRKTEFDKEIFPNYV